ncbi:MAG: helix-turn-helix domain-containing protein [Coriobacteriales bacterium]|jgi:cytoskeletal protein RodZ|nr:helix-turn-helix domain-containing protein [Coriobacteriales bacterium]
MAEGVSYRDWLTEARRREGRTISDVALELHIRDKVLKALEEGDYDNLPLKGYSKNIVSTYAKYIGLDAPVVVKQFLEEYERYERTGRRLKVDDKASLADGAPDHLKAVSDAEKLDQVEQVDAPSQAVISKPTGRSYNEVKTNISNRTFWDNPTPQAPAHTEFTRQVKLHSQAEGNRFSVGSRHVHRHGAAAGHFSHSQSARHFSPAGNANKVGAKVSRRPLFTTLLLVVIILLVLLVWAGAANACAASRADQVVYAPQTTIDSTQTPTASSPSSAAGTGSGNAQNTTGASSSSSATSADSASNLPNAQTGK